MVNLDLKQKILRWLRYGSAVKRILSQQPNCMWCFVD
jgi:hypothetical protein